MTNFKNKWQNEAVRKAAIHVRILLFHVSEKRFSRFELAFRKTCKAQIIKVKKKYFFIILMAICIEPRMCRMPVLFRIVFVPFVLFLR